MRYWTAGESHGHGLLAFLDGFPSGIPVDKSIIDKDLQRRQGGYGRSARQKLETDRVEILTGLWRNRTIGSPITLWVKNDDDRIDETPPVPSPRPGHADLCGAIKYGQGIRPILERSSARETAARVAAGGLARQYLAINGITAAGYVLSIGPLELKYPEAERLSMDEVYQKRHQSVVYSLVPEADEAAKAEIDRCRKDGDSLGGIVEIRVDGVPFGLGTHSQWDRRLDTRLAGAVMSVQGIKGVEIGLGFEAAHRRGRDVHDPIAYDPDLQDTHCQGFTRSSNNAGGIEGGMSNSESIIVRAAMKPIPTMTRALPSIDWDTREAVDATYERSDVCAVPAASVVVEAAVILEVARAMAERTVDP